jgi:hypothetical protein
MEEGRKYASVTGGREYVIAQLDEICHAETLRLEGHLKQLMIADRDATLF